MLLGRLRATRLVRQLVGSWATFYFLSSSQPTSVTNISVPFLDYLLKSMASFPLIVSMLWTRDDKEHFIQLYPFQSSCTSSVWCLSSPQASCSFSKKKTVIVDLELVLTMIPVTFNDTNTQLKTTGLSRRPTCSCGKSSGYHPSKSLSLFWWLSEWVVFVTFKELVDRK